MTGLHISHLALAHLRSHRRAELALDGRPVALFGANGAGKTNLLEAVSLLSPGRGMRRAAAAEIARRPDAPGWQVAATLATPQGPREIVTRSEGGQPRSVRIDDKAVPQTALAGLVRMLWLVPAMDRLWIEGAEGRRRFLDRVAMSFAPDHAEAALGYERAMRDRNRLLKDQVRDAGWYRALEAQMGRAGARLEANRRRALSRLEAAQDDAGSAFPAARLALVSREGPQPDGAEALAAALAESRPRDLAAGRSLVGPHRADLEAVYAAKEMPAADCSTGEQKALLISLILANARALSAETGTAPILLLDEVAAHLDAGRRAALYDEILALGAQAWMTGTGAELFAELGRRAQRFEITEDAGESRVQPREAT
ncbi:DNA replication/repair protein RecF [Roseivivax sp. CAU 1761]